MIQSAVSIRDLHRIGGGTASNLRLKPREALLKPPGISVLRNPTPQHSADQIRAVFPRSAVLHESAKTIGATTEDEIRGAGFDVVPDPTRTLPNHYRIIHPQGAAGFTDENLKKLGCAFANSTGH